MPTPSGVDRIRARSWQFSPHTVGGGRRAAHRSSRHAARAGRSARPQCALSGCGASGLVRTSALTSPGDTGPRAGVPSMSSSARMPARIKHTRWPDSGLLPPPQAQRHRQPLVRVSGGMPVPEVHRRGPAEQHDRDEDEETAEIMKATPPTIRPPGWRCRRRTADSGRPARSRAHEREAHGCAIAVARPSGTDRRRGSRCRDGQALGQQQHRHEPGPELRPQEVAGARSATCG